jgi:hypothetical protein
MRRWFLIAIPLLVVLAIALWLSTGGSHGVTRANFERIDDGMTRAEVDALLGEKFVQHEASSMMGGLLVASWVSYSEGNLTSLMPANTISVTFSDDKVVSKDFQPWTFAGWWRQLRNRIGL